MLIPRTLELSVFTSIRGRKIGQVGKSRWLKVAGIVSAFVVASAIASSAQTYTTLSILYGSDGINPTSGVIQATDGNFYGTTSSGGTNDDGTVFKVTSTGTLTTLYSFCSQANCADGNGASGLIQATDGNFYGTTSGGGNHGGCVYTGCGTFFKITPTGTLTTLYSFCSQANCADGAYPGAGVIQATDGNFYGTTSGGGTNGDGTVFEIASTGTLTTLYSFCSQANCSDGATPYAGLIQATDGNFYGTTSSGGTNGDGTVFEITSTGTLTTLYSFCSQTNCADGSGASGLIQATNGNFYGTTSSGGTNGDGTVFEITSMGALTTLYSFCSQTNCTDGANPVVGVIQATDGNFYGTTNKQGTSGNGTIFEITPAGTLTTLYSFKLCSEPRCTNGSGSGVIQATDGNFYGTTNQGGPACYGEQGTVFKLAPGPSAVTFSPTSLNFCGWIPNETSTEKTIWVTNTGSVPLDFNTFTASGNFAISEIGLGCKAPLAVGKKCMVRLTFTPTGVGTQTGLLTFTDNAANSSQTLPLSGIGNPPVTLLPTVRKYGAAPVGNSTRSKTFWLTNEQNVVLANIAISTTANFAVTATTCTASLAAKSKCTISVAFAPTQPGMTTGQLTVSYNAINSPQTALLKAK
jgi:uncharacterized repeat protein (TIGR03803 family)